MFADDTHKGLHIRDPALLFRLKCPQQTHIPLAKHVYTAHMYPQMCTYFEVAEADCTLPCGLPRRPDWERTTLAPEPLTIQ